MALLPFDSQFFVKMSELSSKYNPADIEEKWYAHWIAKNYFHATPDEREAFSIVIPPPNVTGVLHMGHLLNNTIQDILTRKARMDGKNACWVPGTDHASIATEAKVVKWLREEKGLKKSDITRTEFLEYAFQWKEKYGGIILHQLRRLGASCDWERTAFTMDEVRSQGVLKAFVDLYEQGKLYRDFRMVNWDAEAKTVLSNEEVIYGEEQAQLYYVFYAVEGAENEGITIATQRPETIMGDAAVAVNPKDPRYAHLKDKRVIVPLIGRSIPIIFDDYVDIDFGTGALKVTPAHDPNDYELGKKHHLETIDTLNDDGTLNEKCGIAALVGVDRFEARKRVRKMLEAAGCLVKLEDYRTNIGRSERTQSVVEPRLSLQWYVNMKAIAEPALAAVESDDIEFFPKMYKNTYRYWMENIRDWCISRQLWWGHQIPAWYVGKEVFVALTAQDALAQAQTKLNNPHLRLEDMRQDDDVLDTWFSSWLWPITVFDGFNPNSEDFKYYYPTSVLVTGWDIIFLWVARMAMAGFEWKSQRPFEKVYFTGMVRDKQRRKMSKQLGNSPDALQLLDEYGADGVRFGLLASSPAGGDLMYDDKLVEQGRNFCNKLWNALRLLKGFEVSDAAPTDAATLAAQWLQAKQQQILIDLDENFNDFRLSEAIKTLYNFVWDDFCSWYLEMIKPEYGQPIPRATLLEAEAIFSDLMRMLHPFMPFVTEEIWHQLGNESDVCIELYPKAQTYDNQTIEVVEIAKNVISKVRDTRNARGIKMKDALPLFVIATDESEKWLQTKGILPMVVKLANLSAFDLSKTEPDNAASFIIGTNKYFIVLEEKIDVAAELDKLNKELEQARGFLKSVTAKLSNERFVNNAAAAVVEMERKKMSDGEARIKILEEGIAKLMN